MACFLILWLGCVQSQIQGQHIDAGLTQNSKCATLHYGVHDGLNIRLRQTACGCHALDLRYRTGGRNMRIKA